MHSVVRINPACVLCCITFFVHCIMLTVCVLCILLTVLYFIVLYYTVLICILCKHYVSLALCIIRIYCVYHVLCVFTVLYDTILYTVSIGYCMSKLCTADVQYVRLVLCLRCCQHSVLCEDYDKPSYHFHFGKFLLFLSIPTSWE